MELDSRLGISRHSIHELVQNVRRLMPDNPYHNWHHAVDVAQTLYCLGLQSGVLQAMTDKERLALLVAALCHDLDHPVRCFCCLTCALSTAVIKPTAALQDGVVTETDVRATTQGVNGAFLIRRGSDIAKAHSMSAGCLELHHRSVTVAAPLRRSRHLTRAA